MPFKELDEKTPSGKSATVTVRSHTIRSIEDTVPRRDTAPPSGVRHNTFFLLLVHGTPTAQHGAADFAKMTLHAQRSAISAKSAAPCQFHAFNLQKIHNLCNKSCTFTVHCIFHRSDCGLFLYGTAPQMQCRREKARNELSSLPLTMMA